MSEQTYDLIENPTPRCACALVLDTSLSMQGMPIAKLNEGVDQLWQELLEDDYAKHCVELGIFTFGGTVTTVMDFSPLQEMVEVRRTEKFIASGNTPMGEAVQIALQQLHKRKQQYKAAGVSYYQPWLILMTDGRPTDVWQHAAAELRALAERNEIVVFVIGIGGHYNSGNRGGGSNGSNGGSGAPPAPPPHPQCNMEILSQFCSADRPPLKLAGLKFKELFAWLSQSLSRVSQSSPGGEPGPLPTDGFTIRG